MPAADQFALSVFAFVLALVHASVAMSAPPAPITINARDVVASGLMIELARNAEIPLVVGARTFTARITINETFPSAQHAIDAIVHRSAFKHTRLNGVQVVTDACTGNLPPQQLNPFAGNHLSLNFSRLDVQTALVLLQYVSARAINEAQFSGGANRSVGIALTNQPARAVYQALASATGTGLMSATDGSFHVSEFAPAQRACNGAMPEESVVPSRERALCSRLTMYPETLDVPCQPLEFYRFDEITVRGYIKRGADFQTLVETNDGALWTLMTGQFMGEHYAKVASVSEQGLVFKELFINRYGYPFDRRFLLGFDGVRTELP